MTGSARKRSWSWSGCRPSFSWRCWTLGPSRRQVGSFFACSLFLSFRIAGIACYGGAKVSLACTAVSGRGRAGEACGKGGACRPSTDQPVSRAGSGPWGHCLCAQLCANALHVPPLSQPAAVLPLLGLASSSGCSNPAWVSQPSKVDSLAETLPPLDAGCRRRCARATTPWFRACAFRRASAARSAWWR